MMGSRILIGAPGSGSGKTMLTCGLLTLLKERGLTCRSYKCGPDYIDPMFHRAVLEVESGNLDSYFSGETEICARLARETKDCDVAVIEGVMGYYDGLGGDTTRASSYEIASITKTPAILVINGRGAGLSLAALVKGFLEFQPDSRIAGVIANRTSPMMAERLRKPLEELGIAFLGCMPEVKELQVDSRHLGLRMPGEVEQLEEKLKNLAAEMERCLDIDRLLALAAECGELQPGDEENGFQTGDRTGPGQKKEQPVTVAVAWDEAFCFYYQENLQMLERMGARIRRFSPVHDRELPKEADGILLGGGYPELYGARLSGNLSMLESIEKAAEKGMPVMAECGGFMYLQQELEGTDGILYPMTGILDGSCRNTGRLGRFGYLELTGLDEGPVKGHEFHYWDSTCNGSSCRAVKPSGGKEWDCMVRKGRILAGYPHLYYPSNPGIARSFIEQCREYRRERTVC